MTPFITSKLRSKLLSYFFTNPEKQLYVRELAAILGEDPGNLSRELRALEIEGVFTSLVRGRSKFYSLDKKYPPFTELKNMIFKTEGVEGALSRITLAYEGIKCAFIYGSYAKGKDNKDSDIDLVVIGDFPRDDFTRKIRQLESRLGRDINFNSYTEAEFEKEKKKKGGFLNIVVGDKVILLKGRI